MFQFPGFPYIYYLFIYIYSATRAVSFLIRTSAAHSLICSYPRLFAAYHVLLRRLAPRHPPCALISLIVSDTPFGIPIGSSLIKALSIFFVHISLFGKHPPTRFYTAKKNHRLSKIHERFLDSSAFLLVYVSQKYYLISL